ncbi:MAG: hypothetical protein PHW32_02720 [Bacilli bacterium]|nr:hypothetical protein [Bacilli bacterium]MDD4282746.1 hypothetical protein [Bacilli bacterium]MDD4718869.1 hypothetical protein [Bacilli bacterium]
MKRKLIFIVAVLLVAVVGCGKPNYKALETELESLAGKYYEEQLKGKVLGLDEHHITLKSLEDVNYDISKFVKENCDKTSYSLVQLTLDENREVVGDYKVENHLTCGEYSTENQK